MRFGNWLIGITPRIRFGRSECTWKLRGQTYVRTSIHAGPVVAARVTMTGVYVPDPRHYQVMADGSTRPLE